MTPEEREANRLAEQLIDNGLLRDQVTQGLRSVVRTKPYFAWIRSVRKLARKMRVPPDEMLQAVIERAIHLSRSTYTDD